MKAASILIALIAMPIGFYIQYSVLQAIHADRLLMFLFWVNVPAFVVIQILSKLAEDDKK
jgi:hypothetical protein